MTIWRDLSIVWSLVHVLVLFVFLYESRFCRKKTLVLTHLFMGPLCILNAVLYVVLGPETMGQILIFSCILPSLVFFYLMAKHRDGRFFFTFCLADTVSYWVIFLTCILDYYVAGNRYVFMFISRLLAFPLMEIIAWKFLRKRYHEMQQTVEKGWGSFAVVSAVFYVLLIVMSDVPTIITSMRHRGRCASTAMTCAKLPPERRYIRCKCLSEPQLMFQISNPYEGELVFDAAGRPVSREKGHGIGTRSIAAFCEKHGAHCEYKADKGMFSLRILVME